MDIEIIESVEVTPSNELLLVLSSRGKPTYQYIYREAAGVFWDTVRGGFKSTERKEWSYAQWFRHIVAVVKSGLGVELRLVSSASWVNVPQDIKHEIEHGYAI